MQKELLQHLVNYTDIYLYVASGEKTRGDIKEFMMQDGISEPTARRNVKVITEINQGMFNVKDDRVWLNKELVQQVMQEAVDELGLPMGSASIELIEEKDLEIKELQSKLKLQTVENEKLQRKNQKQAEKLKKVKSVTEKQKLQVDRMDLEKKKLMQELISAKLDQKIVFASDPQLIPAPQEDEGLFLDDSIVKLDLDKSISKYGGARESFYNVAEDDVEHPIFDENGQVPGHELNKENYLLRVARGIMPERFFKKWAEDMQEEKQFQKEHNLKPKKSKAKADARAKADQNKTQIQKRTEERLRKNKLSIQTIINDDRMTDQMKLQMYARFSDYRGTEMERLINFAADYGINANWFIQVLEDADTCDNYENVRDCLRMFAKPSEYRKKVDFARELLDGVWNVKVDYDGEPTLFAFVPVREINEIRDCLKLPPSKFSYKECGQALGDLDASVEKQASNQSESAMKSEMIEKPDFVETYCFKEDEVDPDFDDYGLDSEVVDYEDYEENE